MIRSFHRGGSGRGHGGREFFGCDDDTSASFGPRATSLEQYWFLYGTAFKQYGSLEQYGSSFEQYGSCEQYRYFEQYGSSFEQHSVDFNGTCGQRRRPGDDGG